MYVYVGYLTPAQREGWRATRGQTSGAGGARRVRRRRYVDGQIQVASMGHLRLMNVNESLEKRDVHGPENAARVQFRNQNLHVERLRKIRGN